MQKLFGIIKIFVVITYGGTKKMRAVGTMAIGVRTPVIRKGDNLV